MRLKSKVIETIVMDSLSPEPLSGIPQKKQVNVNSVMSKMIGQMFEAIEGEGGDEYDVMMDDITQVLDHASLVFTKLGRSLREEHKARKEFTN